jgi:hypothetical protein
MTADPLNLAVPAWPGADESEDISNDTGERSAWDVVVMAGTELPGIAKVSGLIAQKIDVKEAPERSGATLTHLGAQPATWDIELTMWTARHLRDWDLVVPFISPKSRGAGGRPRVLDVVHPALELHGIRRAYVRQLSMLQPGSQPGTWTTRLSCIEWRPSTPSAASTPTSSSGSSIAGLNVAVPESPATVFAADAS